MGRIAEQTMPHATTSPVPNVGARVIIPSTPQTPLSSKLRSNTHSLQPVPMDHLPTGLHQLSIPPIINLDRSSPSSPVSSSLASKTTPPAPIRATTTQKSTVSTSTQQQSSNPHSVPSKTKVFTVTTAHAPSGSTVSVSRIPTAPAPKPTTLATLKMPLPPVSQLTASKPLDTTNTTTSTKTTFTKIAKGAANGNIASKPAPLQPANANRLNQLHGRTNASVHTDAATKSVKSAKPAISDPKNQMPTYKNGMKRLTTVPVSKQPFASQRSVVAPIRSVPQAPLLHTSMRPKRTAALEAKDKQHPPQPLVGKENAPQLYLRTTVPHSKSVPPAISKRTEVVKRQLTVAVTPELMKRRRAKLKEEPRLTTEELRAMEAERLRREFFQDLHKKNANRGLAPRTIFNHPNKPIKVSSKPTGHWR